MIKATYIKSRDVWVAEYIPKGWKGQPWCARANTKEGCIWAVKYQYENLYKHPKTLKQIIYG